MFHHSEFLKVPTYRRNLPEANVEIDKGKQKIVKKQVEDSLHLDTLSKKRLDERKDTINRLKRAIDRVYEEKDNKDKFMKSMKTLAKYAPKIVVTEVKNFKDVTTNEVIQRDISEGKRFHDAQSTVLKDVCKTPYSKFILKIKSIRETVSSHEKQFKMIERTPHLKPTTMKQLLAKPKTNLHAVFKGIEYLLTNRQ